MAGFCAWIPICAFSLALLLPALASGYEFATDTGDVGGNRLSWPQGQPMHFTQHIQDGGQLPAWLLHAEARRAFQTWSSPPESNVTFIEDPVFAGVDCPHALPEGVSAQDVCGGDLPPHDFRSALFFIDTVWPFGEEVIALTTLSWQEGGGLVDADIAFNALDYDWSTGTDDVLVDFQSITLHEIGHFLGLAHSMEDDAVMRVDYEEGQLVRVLGSDDRAGIAELYPCNAPPCEGSITVEEASCSTAGAQAVGLMMVLSFSLVLLLALRQEQARRAAGGFVLLAALVFLPTSPQSSTVLALDIEALVERADRVVRATVLENESWRDRIVWTRTRLAVTESWLGEGPSEVSLVQPGGRVPGFGTRVFGVPEFAQGEDVVVFLSGERVLGLAQGKFSIGEGGALSRDLRDLALARVGGHRAPSLVRAPSTLDGLRASVVVDDL